MTIEEINKWLEQKAVEAEKLSNSNWSEYYRGLINFDKQKSFRISTCDMSSPILGYIMQSTGALGYRMVGYSGCCEFIKM